MRTESKWAARVASWRSSGLSAAEFCAGRDYQVSGLRYWASRLRQVQAATAPRDVRIARVVAPGAGAEAETPIVLEVAGVRIAVRRGFDREVLRDVIDTLASRAA
jgi:transposase